MSQVIVRMSVSLDGFGAGPRQSLEHPLGEGGHAVHEWMFPTRTFYAMVGREGGETGVDDEEAVRITRGIGATVMGRNMFGPVRGPWTEPLWEGWWGPEPPYHGPVFVLTHHARDPLPMEGGTTFHFVTGGIEDAIARARDVAGDRDISVAGGVSTARQALRAGLVDRIELHLSPVFLGAGERLFDDMDGATDGFRCVEVRAGERATHVHLARDGG